MACLKPLIVKVVDFKPFIKKLSNYVYRIRDELKFKLNEDTGIGYKILTTDSRSQELELDNEYYHTLKHIEIPCGNCLQCRLKYSKDWAIRCSHEAGYYKCNFFVTLTYDDDHLTKGYLGNATLVSEHFTQFVKSLRQKMKRQFNHNGVRFFGCGEYGDLTHRPHYHLILFNCPLPDLSIDFIDKDGQRSRHRNGVGDYMYYSQFIQDLWPYGNITVDDCNYNTEAYVSRYILKKQKGNDAKIYVEKEGVLPPFIRMSLKPGIGEKYLEDNYDHLIENPGIILPRTDKEPLIAGLPTYYKKKIRERDPELYKKVFTDKASDDAVKQRSLIAGKQKINVNRAIREEHIVRQFETFGRNKIE